MRPAGGEPRPGLPGQSPRTKTTRPGPQPGDSGHPHHSSTPNPDGTSSPLSGILTRFSGRAARPSALGRARMQTLPPEGRVEAVNRDPLRWSAQTPRASAPARPGERCIATRPRVARQGSADEGEFVPDYRPIDKERTWFWE